MTDENGEDGEALRIAERMLAAEGVGPLLGVTVEAAGIGCARVRMRVSEAMLNGFGTIHGGMLFTLADSAFAYACNSHGVTSVAAQASISFLAPARLGEELVAEAREAALVGRSGVYVVEVRTTDGRPVAVFHGLSRTIERGAQAS